MKTGRKTLKDDSTVNWIEALAASEPGPIEKTIKLELPAEAWAEIAQGAAVNGWTINETIQFLFVNNVDLPEWYNDDYSSKTWGEYELEKQAYYAAQKAK